LGVVLTALFIALAAGYGTHLLVTAVGPGWTGLAPGPRQDRGSARPAAWRRRSQAWLIQAGVGEVPTRELTAMLGAMTVAGTVAGGLVFGALVPAVAVGVFMGTLPVAVLRRRRARRIDEARDAWPRMIEELRILTASAGRSIPQALFQVGRDGPSELRPAFAAAHREWLLSTDFARTLDVLKHQLADPAADVTCETLLIAHELGGTDLDRRLEDLAEDRRVDGEDRKDALARQAGARFARRFVLVVPAGMAMVGLSVGTGRAAYNTAAGQAVVLTALGVVGACWWWAGRIMRLPDEQRVFP
jgi:tight adherence protein B